MELSGILDTDNPVHLIPLLLHLVFLLSPPQRLKGFFSGGEDPLSNVSAGTELQATAESAGASARYHAQDGRHPGEAISCGLLAGVACVPCISKNGVQDFEVK